MFSLKCQKINHASIGITKFVYQYELLQHTKDKWSLNANMSVLIQPRLAKYLIDKINMVIIIATFTTRYFEIMTNRTLLLHLCFIDSKFTKSKDWGQQRNSQFLLFCLIDASS